MTDRDSVVKILPKAVAFLQREADRHDTIARLMLSEYAEAVDSAFTLLTATEPLRPRARGRVERFWVCGECGTEIGKGENFCKHCGRGAKWED